MMLRKSDRTTPKISVIIPVFNVEKYLQQCLDSVLNQTLREIEVICVDDGSTDRSLEILREYALFDKRLQIIEQKNVGAGAARNRGLVIAKGEYLSFLDSDDFFELNMLEEMYNKAIEDESDIVVCGYHKYDQQTGKTFYTRRINGDFLKRSPIVPEEFEKNLFTVCFTNPWTKIFKRKLFTDNKLQFENLKNCNDFTCVITAEALSTRISCIDKSFIYYRMNITTQISANRFGKNEYFIQAVDALERNFRHFGIYEKFYQKMYTTVSDCLNYETQGNIELLRDEAKRTLSPRLYSDLFNVSEDPFPPKLVEKYLNVENEKNCNIFEQINEIHRNLPTKHLPDYEHEFAQLMFGMLWNYCAKISDNNVKEKFVSDAKKYVDDNFASLVVKYADIQAKYNQIFIPVAASIIVAAYNVADYVAECLDSLVGQTQENIEIICVNDGSTDNTLEILQEYASKDKRIKIIDQENQGLSVARNNALKVAQGRYIIFVDADDYIAENAVEKIFFQMEKNNLDLLSYSGVNFDHTTRVEEDNPYWDFHCVPKNFNRKSFNWKDAKTFLQYMAVSACLTAYKLGFIKAEEVEFPPHLYFEDNLFFVKAATRASHMGIIYDKLYYRRIRLLSVTQNWNVHFADYIQIATQVLEYLKDFDQELYKKYAWSYCAGIQNRMNEFNKQDQRRYQNLVADFFEKYAPPRIKLKVSKKVTIIKLFNFLPLLEIKERGGRKTYKVLGLPILTVRKMADNLTVKHYFCGLQWLKKQTAKNKITTKYKLFGLPLLKISRKKKSV